MLVGEPDRAHVGLAPRVDDQVDAALWRRDVQHPVDLVDAQLAVAVDQPFGVVQRQLVGGKLLPQVLEEALVQHRWRHRSLGALRDIRPW
jgi:hypothetical protein